VSAGHETVAWAKLNLGLRVLGPRPDGFHEVRTTMALVDVGDHVALQAGAAGDGDTLARLPSGDVVDLAAMPLDASNLILRAVAAYRREAGALAPPPLTLTVRKRIPLAAGLGGGSSDAAAVLRLLARAWPAPVDIVAIAAELGSDVPFFLSGAAAARAEGRGERLTPVSVAPFTAVLINPGAAVSAGDAYRWWSQAVGGSAAVAGAAAAPWRGLDVTNDLEPGVAQRVPEVAAALAWLRDRTAAPVVMSGSGATCFALVERDDDAVALAARARRETAWWVAVARGASTLAA
jgi:4-diphosphocytidyl-2-C-methyl-D-erythritol kinase